MKKPLTKWFLCMPLFVVFAYAQKFDSCYNKARSTADTIACIDKEYRYYDSRLNRAYRQIRKIFAEAPKEQQYLKEAQRAWILYRDKKCQFEGYPMRGGTGEGLLVYGCKARETQKRTQELEEIVKELRSMEL